MRDDETIDVGPVHVLGEDGYCTGDCPHPIHAATLRGFVCASCGRSCVTGWSDTDANTEYAERYGQDAVDTDGNPTEPTESVCDDCYPKILAWCREQGILP